MKSVAVFFADGFEEVEALTPVDYLRRAGVELYTVAIPSDTMNDKYIVTGSHKVPMIMDLTFEEYLDACKDGLPDLLFCPGGSRGADNLAACKELLDHLEEAWDKGKFVSAICASPAVVLGKTKILAGKKWTCYPDMESNAKNEYLNGYSDKVFVTDGNLITARGAGAAEEFAMELVKLLAGQESADKIHKGTLQR
ncbi:MAG: DJ-1/PfpI family protein [Treponema sp.]|nr:DJ-1/PfpI family protein [Treponema sp.]